MFTQAGGKTRHRLAAFNNKGKLLDWNPGADSWVYAIAAKYNLIYAGGAFMNIGYGDAQLPRKRLAGFETDGTLLNWNYGINGAVRTLIPDGNIMFAGGDFTTINGQSRNHLAAFHAAGELLNWLPQANAPVYSLALDSATATVDALYVGGNFTAVGETPRNSLGAVNTYGSNEVLPWEASLYNGPAQPQVYALAENNGVIYSGGQFTSVFTSVGEQMRNNLASFNKAGQLLSWGPVVDADVYTLALNNDRNIVYAGGAFTSANGETRPHVAAFDEQGNLLSTWNPTLNGDVSSLAVASHNLTQVVYAGGAFTQVNDKPTPYFAAVDATTGKVLW